MRSASTFADGLGERNMVVENFALETETRRQKQADRAHRGAGGHGPAEGRRRCAVFAASAARERLELVRYRTKHVTIRSSLKAQAHRALAKNDILIRCRACSASPAGRNWTGSRCRARTRSA